MDRLKAPLLLLLSGTFVTLGVWMAVAGDTPGDRAMGAATATFFAACLLVFIGQMLPHRAPPAEDGLILIQPDRVQLAILAAASLLMAIGSPAIGTQAAARGEPLVAGIGWFGGLFFGAAAVIGVWRLIRLRPVLRLDPAGVTSLAGPGWTLHWKDIAGIDRFTHMGQRFLILTPRPGIAPPPSVMGRLHEALGFPAFLVGTQGTGLRIEALEGLMMAYWERFGL